MNKIGNFTRLVGLGIATAGLVACGGGSSDGSSSGGGTGQMSLAVTDAPVDSASRVVVRFTHVELQPSDGERIRIDLGEDESVREIDLLALQGEDYEFLFEDEEVPAGDYEWIRFYLEPEEGASSPPLSNFATSSFIEFVDDYRENLTIPGGLQAGLQLSSGFSVADGEEVSFTVDFDLRKAIREDPQFEGYHRMRRSLRLVDNREAGAITGTVDPDRLPADFTCEEREEGLHACPGAAVYVFEGLDREPRDLRDDDDDAVTTANVHYRHVEATGDWEYRYTAGFLEAGDYTVALTFQADEDDPEAATPIDFVDQANAEVEAGETTEVNF
ncbi:DUF4382 domain-containing protein [Thioalkalivibrio sp. ALE9]|uniref:DUF4382 domain-containing protein n=1 Tax=Thioalkalivibrio sp. ALE9 TaxID=1158169 RepID=UPI000475D69B|nr:DUF4382 domain-containing protein [Thioalkalivibrio sp. ALE9]